MLACYIILIFYAKRISHLMDSRVVRVVEFSDLFINWYFGSNPDGAHFFISFFLRFSSRMEYRFVPHHLRRVRLPA